MPDIQRRTRTSIRHEYVIPSPAYAKDIGLAIHWATQAMPEGRRGCDDAYFVEASDDEVIVWWPEEQVDPVPVRAGELDLFMLVYVRDSHAYVARCYCGETFTGTDPEQATHRWTGHAGDAHSAVLR